MPNPTPSDNLFDLSGQVAIVTGTSRGLGQHFARALAKAGADLSPNEPSTSTRSPRSNREMKSLGRRTLSLELDVRDRASIQKMVADAQSHFGQIHILVNNAGCNVRKPALDVTWDDWNLILDTNLRGSFFVAQGIARGMIAAQLRPHHQRRLGHQRRRFRRPGTLRRQPRRHQATHHEPRRRLG